MRYILLVLVLLGAIALLFTTDVFKGFVGNIVPGLQTRAEKERLESDKKDPEPNGFFKALRNLDSSNRIDRSKLIGGWLDENTAEYIIFREDGKARVAMAFKVEAEADNQLVMVYATITGILYTPWELDGRSVSFTDPRFETMNFVSLKYHQRQPNWKYEKIRARDVPDSLRKQVEPGMKAESNTWLKENRVGGKIVKLEDRVLVIQYKGGQVTYERVSPYLTRDPDGTYAPTVVFKGGAGQGQWK